MKSILSSLLILSVSTGLAACGPEDETGRSVAGLRACLPAADDGFDHEFILDVDGDGVGDCVANRTALSEIEFVSAMKYATDRATRHDLPARYAK